MELKAVMKWISKLKFLDSAGSSLGTEQALITQLSRNTHADEQAGITQLSRQ